MELMGKLCGIQFFYLLLSLILFFYYSATIVSPSLTVYLLSKGFSLQDVIAAGFTVENTVKDDVDNDAVNTPKQYDRFRFYVNRLVTLLQPIIISLIFCRDRLMIPIKNEAGEIVGFGGRIMNNHKMKSNEGRQPAKYGNEFSKINIYCSEFLRIIIL